MTKRLSKYILPAVVISVLIYFIIGGVWRKKKDQEIKRDGIYHYAIVTGKTVSKVIRLHFIININLKGKSISLRDTLVNPFTSGMKLEIQY